MTYEQEILRKAKIEELLDRAAHRVMDPAERGRMSGAARRAKTLALVEKAS